MRAADINNATYTTTTVPAGYQSNCEPIKPPHPHTHPLQEPPTLPSQITILLRKFIPVAPLPQEPPIFKEDRPIPKEDRHTSKGDRPMQSKEGKAMLFKEGKDTCKEDRRMCKRA